MHTEWIEVSKNDTVDENDESKSTTRFISQNVSGNTDTMRSSTTSTGETKTLGMIEGFVAKSFREWLTNSV